VVCYNCSQAKLLLKLVDFEVDGLKNALFLFVLMELLFALFVMKLSLMLTKYEVQVQLP
jgi:hypothetical protein